MTSGKNREPEDPAAPSSGSMLIARGGSGELDQRARWKRGARLNRLGRAPGVNYGNLMNAGNCATGRARLLGEKFAVTQLVGVINEGNPGIAALLRAIVDKAVLADIEVARTGAATPTIFLAAGDVVLKTV